MGRQSKKKDGNDNSYPPIISVRRKVDESAPIQVDLGTAAAASNSVASAAEKEASPAAIATEEPAPQPSTRAEEIFQLPALTETSGLQPARQCINLHVTPLCTGPAGYPQARQGGRTRRFPALHSPWDIICAHCVRGSRLPLPFFCGGVMMGSFREGGTRACVRRLQAGAAA